MSWLLFLKKSLLDVVSNAPWLQKCFLRWRNEVRTEEHFLHSNGRPHGSATSPTFCVRGSAEMWACFAAMRWSSSKPLRLIPIDSNSLLSCVLKPRPFICILHWFAIDIRLPTLESHYQANQTENSHFLHIYPFLSTYLCTSVRITDLTASLPGRFGGGMLIRRCEREESPLKSETGRLMIW